MILQSEVDRVDQHRRLKILLIVLTTLLVAVILYTVIRVSKEEIATPIVNDSTNGVENSRDKLPESFPKPERTDFEAVVPTDFPADIPLEKGAKVKQSYILEYPDQKQLSVVFSSIKTVGENVDLYADFLKKQNWNISNTYEGEKISSLYATKEEYEINVTIIDDAGIVLVSISILKKS